MKTTLSIAYFAISLLASNAHAISPVSYNTIEKKATERVSIKTISVNAVAGMNANAINKVNAALTAASATFAKESEQCKVSAQGHLWGYRLIFEKILLSKKYLSIVFSKSTVCAGSPDIEKEARVFLLSSGDLVPSRVLLKQLFPFATLNGGNSTNKESIDLNEKMIETMISDTKSALKAYDDRCDFYLKNISYHIWVDDQNLILFPEFLQADSFCQKEYILRIAY